MAAPVPLFLLSNELKKLASTPSLVPAPAPGFPPSTCHTDNAFNTCIYTLITYRPRLDDSLVFFLFFSFSFLTRLKLRSIKIQQSTRSPSSCLRNRFWAILSCVVSKLRLRWFVVTIAGKIFVVTKKNSPSRCEVWHSVTCNFLSFCGIKVSDKTYALNLYFKICLWAKVYINDFLTGINMNCFFTAKD